MLQEIPSYSPEIQVSITRAAGVLHNFARVSDETVLNWSWIFLQGYGFKLIYHFLNATFQTGDVLPQSFPLPNCEDDPWCPLKFNNPGAWRDAMAEDMWRDYLRGGQFREVVTPFQRAQRRAQQGEMPTPTAENPGGAADIPIVL